MHSESGGAIGFADAAGETSPRGEPRTARAPARSERAPLVLVVDDNDMVAELAADMLGLLGYRSIVARNAHEALKILDEGERPDLLFSDIIMPGGLGGLQLAKKVRSLYPELPILLTTGYSDSLVTEVEFPLLVKPYALETFKKALNNLL